MDNDLDLPALRAFRAVVREGSFSAAALSLRAPKSTLSKRVANLESMLGVRLIERTTRSLRITAEGEVLAARADRILSDADDIRRTLGELESTPRGHLRIAVTPGMGNMVLGKIAAQFRAAYPDITLEAHFLDRPPDMLEEGFDGCVRFGPLEDSGQIARLITRGSAIAVAKPGLEGLEDLLHPRDLARLPRVALATAWRHPWTLQRGEESFEIKDPPQLMLGSHVAVLDAVIEGAGVAILPRMAVRRDIQLGRLTQVLPDWASPEKEIFFVYPSAQSITARLRAFIDFVASRMEQTALLCVDPPYSAASASSAAALASTSSTM